MSVAMKQATLIPLIGLLIGAPASAQEKKPAPSPGEIVAAAPADDWVEIAADDLLVMTLAPDARGKARQVIMQLAPAPFSQGWVANIRTLARAHWYDGNAIYRVQDNYVTQWGDPNADDEKKARPLPDGLKAVPESDYTARLDSAALKTIAAGKPAKGDARPIVSTGKDAYADGGYFSAGWPIAISWIDRKRPAAQWPVHCYGAVGVARGMSPETGNGTALYAVNGHAPRHLDRNIAVAGRIIEGMEHLSALPRGTEALGFYKDVADAVPIQSVRLASELPAAERPRFQYLSTESASFAHYADARGNRRDPFFIVPAGGADICNIPVPIRRKP